MIISRSPLRISLGGGGTDLPSYYEKFGGYVIAGAIDQYVYVSVHNSPRSEFLLRYSEIERVPNIDGIQHPLIRECLRLMNIQEKNLEITSMADIPAGTGLGSSGAFTTSLLRALHKYRHRFVEPNQLAELACHVELDILKEPIGKQDQYIAAFGGITCFNYCQDGKVEVKPLELSGETVRLLEDNLLLFSTGYSRSASKILADQDTKTKVDDGKMLDNLHQIKDIGFRSAEALLNQDLIGFAELMNEHWELKKSRSQGMSNDNINKWYEIARENGAIGGKLIGAGGGGFLMFYTEQAMKLRHAMAELGLPELRFRFDFEGTRLL